MKRRASAAAGGLSLLAALAACGGSGSSSSGGGSCTAGTAGVNLGGTPNTTIQATDSQTFSPASGAAGVGQVVQWTDNGSLMHTVTFDSANASCLTDPALNPGSTWQVKFTQAGTYTYHCTVHPGMSGTIVVS